MPEMKDAPEKPDGSGNRTEAKLKKERKNMTRNTAREIATHLAYELSFTDLPMEELEKFIFLDAVKLYCLMNLLDLV